SIGHAPLYVKGLTYDRLYQQFERPHHALGNRYRNPIARAYDMVMYACRRILSPLTRIEIAIRIRPE
ncbi:MAG: hypothetical protein ACREBU_23595, partial [Nitrososphaera sp.]